MPCRVIKIKLSELAKRDPVQLFAKRTTKVRRYDNKKQREITRIIHEGTYIEGSFSMKQNETTATIYVNKVAGGNDHLMPDYYWFTAADFDWYVSIPVKVD
jgi:hypothetical protein